MAIVNLKLFFLYCGVQIDLSIVPQATLAPGLMICGAPRFISGLVGLKDVSVATSLSPQEIRQLLMFPKMKRLGQQYFTSGMVH
jgi:hypothetical protein